MKTSVEHHKRIDHEEEEAVVVRRALDEPDEPFVIYGVNGSLVTRDKAEAQAIWACLGEALQDD